MKNAMAKYPHIATLEGFFDVDEINQEVPELGFSLKKLYRKAKKATRKVKRVAKKAYRGGKKIYRPIRDVTRMAKKYTPKEYKKYWNLKTYAQKDPRLKAIYKGYQQARDVRRVYNRGGGLKAFKKLKNIASLVPGGKNYYRGYKAARNVTRSLRSKDGSQPVQRKESSSKPFDLSMFRRSFGRKSPSSKRIVRSRREQPQPVQEEKKTNWLLPAAAAAGIAALALM